MPKKPQKSVKWNIATKKTLEVHRRLNEYLRANAMEDRAALIDSYEEEGKAIKTYKAGKNTLEGEWCKPRWEKGRERRDD